jgi:hypothetical protein
MEYVLIRLPSDKFVLLWVVPNANKRDLVVGSILQLCGEDTQWADAFSRECLLTSELAAYFYRINADRFFGMFYPRKMNLRVGDIICKTDTRFSTQVSF